MTEAAVDIYKDGGIYNTLDYGAPYVSRGLRFARFVSASFTNRGKVLCVGCGNGYEIIEYLNLGWEAYGTELHTITDVPILENRIIIARVPDLPFKDKEFDLLTCTEVIEHIPEEETEDFLRECYRVSENCFFSIATRGDHPFNTHINIHHPTWWLNKIEEIFGPDELAHFQYKPIYDIQLTAGVTHRRRFVDGVIFYVNRDF